MAVERRFLIAPSFARLLRHESVHTSHITEGYFHSQPDECRFVRVEREQAALVLASRGEDGMMLEDVAVIPHRQAEALMDVTAGTAAFDRMTVPIASSRVAVLDHFLMLSSLNVLTMPVEDLSEPPEWFGPEITHRPEFDTSSLALNGRPSFREVEITNRALEVLLDTLEVQRTSSPASGEPTPSEPEPVALPDPGTTSTELAPEAEERTSLTRRQQVAEPALRRVAERSEITPKHLRRLEREAGRAIFRESTSDDDEGAARMAQALAPHTTPLH